MKEFFKYVLATVVGIVAVSIIGFFLMFMIVGVLISTTEKQISVQNNSMLVLPLDRQIVDRNPDDPFEDIEIPGFETIKTVGLDDIKTSLDKAVNDDRIKGIYLKLSAFNGGMASAEEIRNMLIDFKGKCDKPVYAYGDSYDQKSYYLATVADKIVIHPLGSVDFRGLGGEMMFYKNLLEKIGVEIQVVRGPNNKFKAAVEPFMLEQMSDENREQQLRYMSSLWNHMLTGISETRNISVDELNTLADEVQTFKQGTGFVEIGLVDYAKYKDEVLDDMREIAGISGKKGIPVVSVTDYADVEVKGFSEKYSRNKIAVIYASGDIGMSMGGEAIFGDELGREIRKVRQDSTYKAIVLRVNSPGGAVFDSEVIWREAKLAAEEKTLVVSFGDVAASGGYYISCPADKIVAQPNTITGSIGIFGTIPNFGELMNDKLGITTDVVKTNKNSDLLTLTRPMTGYEKQLLENYIARGYDTFLSHVAEGRGMTKEDVDAIGQGRVWSGENAKEIGLVDEFGGLDDAVELAAEIAGVEEYRTISLPFLPDPFEEFFKTGTDNLRARFLKNELGEKYRYYEYWKKATSFNGIFARMPYDIYVN
ncbi:signal peptide peptidase SppA [Maribellus comscasis]|uniref:Signal peptide peptidase SppA n=1 Tax=Maribellus comscasis TaxID=2681766 RepID=A0A6I6JV07_9BACT|nr:signal peptide peptidase SppA [Maribellus comscasis]QGY44920.1 signal peptide peptidase SppA [Maribellus comscasis]